MKQSVMGGDMPFLPEEMIRSILMRLPVKSLLRFRCVCKNWSDLIKTPYFISEHLRHSTQQNPFLLFQRNGLWLLNCKMQFLKIGKVPFTSPLLIGSSNGLLCFHVIRYPTPSPDIFLCNPATGELQQVPWNAKVVDPRFDIGFGFSPIVEDFKIVLTYRSNNGFTRAEVYSLRSGSWKEVEYGIENIGLISQQIIVNGAIFWHGVRWKQCTYYDSIVSFDIANEVFSLIPFPDRPAPTSRFRLAEYENKLAVIQASESLIKLWVMEDGMDASWVKKFSCHVPFLVHPLAIWMNQIICRVIETKYLGWNRELKIALLNISAEEWKTFDIIEFDGVIGSGSDSGRDFIQHHAESLCQILDK